MRATVWLAATISYFVLPCLTQDLRGLPQSSSATTNMEHLRFKTRKIGGRKIVVLSLKMDPERGRRSILVPDAEGLLRPFPMAHHLRHHHRFLSPFEDEERFSLNGSIDWGSSYHSDGQEESLTEGEVKGLITTQLLQPNENAFTDLGESLGPERMGNKLESAALTLSEKVKKKKEKQKRRNKGRRGEKQKKRNNKKKSNKTKKKKPRLKMLGQEACQFKALKKCAKKLRLLPKKLVAKLSDFEKCDQRKEFLECVEKRRDHKPCKQRSVARGNLPSLRSWIKKLFWTSSSCLLNESMKGR